MELFVTRSSSFCVQKMMHSRRKTFIKPMVKVMILLGFSLMFVGYILYENRLTIPWIKKQIHIIQWTENSDQQLLGPNNQRIYFHETSGRNQLNMRQSCAVESTAKENPDRPIQLIMQTNISSINTHGTWLNVLSNYPNVAVILINEMDYFRDNPLEDWYRKGEWRQSTYKVEHFADYIRMLSSLKGGGLYMDLDFVTMKRFDISNFLAVEDASVETISSGIFHFDYGHRLISEIVKDLAAHYQPKVWSAHGPALIFSIMSRICGLKKEQPLSNECQDVALMPYNFVYPIHYPDWRIYFQKSTRNIMQWINGSYAVHVWNKMSHSEPLLIGSDQVYSTLASRHCPFTVARAAEFISYF
jgi:lactosylceramide 4-alpha-galactosyltransferase